MANVRVVTDSAADIPAELVARHRIKVVPLTISFGDDAYLDGVELPVSEFWSKLKTSQAHPSTAAPSAGDFEQAFRRCIEEGADGIVSVHISSKLSATYQSAVLGARAITDVPIEIIDSLSVTAATGVLALRAAELAEKGMTPAEIKVEVESLRNRVGLFGALEGLEFLRRGGRIGGAQAMLGTMLQFKPVITVTGGTVEPAGRVRTRAKAMEHLAGLIKQKGDLERLIVVDGDATDVDNFRGLLGAAAGGAMEDTWTLGPVVGTHTGPLVGAIYILRP